MPVPDPRHYDFEKLWVMKAPMWRTFVCLEHSISYDDIVGVPIPMADYHKAQITCGCMVPFNQIAFEFLKGFKDEELQECGTCGHLKRFHGPLACFILIAGNPNNKCDCKVFVARKR